MAQPPGEEDRKDFRSSSDQKHDEVDPSVDFSCQRCGLGEVCSFFGTGKGPKFLKKSVEFSRPTYLMIDPFRYVLHTTHRTFGVVMYAYTDNGQCNLNFRRSKPRLDLDSAAHITYWL